MTTPIIDNNVKQKVHVSFTDKHAEWINRKVDILNLSSHEPLIKEGDRLLKIQQREFVKWIAIAVLVALIGTAAMVAFSLWAYTYPIEIMVFVALTLMVGPGIGFAVGCFGSSSSYHMMRDIKERQESLRTCKNEDFVNFINTNANSSSLTVDQVSKCYRTYNNFKDRNAFKLKVETLNAELAKPTSEKRIERAEEAKRRVLKNQLHFEEIKDLTLRHINNQKFSYTEEQILKIRKFLKENKFNFIFYEPLNANWERQRIIWLKESINPQPKRRWGQAGHFSYMGL